MENIKSEIYEAENFGISWLNLSFPFPVELHWLKPRYDIAEFSKNNSFKVLLINSEPSEWCISHEELKIIGNKFDVIIGKKTIDGLNNVVVQPFGSSWIRNVNEKEFGVSNLLSMGNHGSLLQGHLFRIAVSLRLNQVNSKFYNIYKSQYFDRHIDKLNFQIHSFFSSIPIYPQESKEFLYNKTFNIAIENSREKNYFTEKIIDCFRSFTIPIYWGCENISEHFDDRGIIFINDIEEVQSTIENLTIKDYLSRVPYILENYERSKKYWDYKNNISTIINNNYFNK